MRRSLRLTSLLLLWLTTAVAYGQTVTGKVTSASDGAPMPGVSILLKGTTTGTATDTEGRFTLNVPDVTTATLAISFIGYASQDIPLAGRTSVDVVLSEDVSQLGEVVVTALGVQREAKTLTYATQSVKASQLTEVRDANNVLNSLQGKVANAQITQGSGGPGSGARIVMRGNRSIQGSNNALIVVDGVPINNNTLTQAGNDFGSIQNSDGASSLNPDDIESVNILRGASAAALYGSQAGNGVIVITTKRGSKERISIDVNSGIQAESAFALPKVQNSYGQGNAGEIKPFSGTSWGPRMEGQSYTNRWGEAQTYSPQEDNIKDYFRTGVSLNNSIGIRGGSEKMQTYLSYTNNKVQGIVRGNDMNRHNATLRLTNNITKKLTTDAKVTYLYQEIQGRPRTGEENSPVIDIYQIPRSMSTHEAKSHLDSTNALGEKIPISWPSTNGAIYQNPYWMIKRTEINEVRNRVMGFLSATYEFDKRLTITGRANLDKSIDLGEQKYSQGTFLWATQHGGLYEKSTYTLTQQWYELSASGRFDIGPDVKFDYRAGTIYQDILSDQDVVTANGLNVVNMFKLQNALNRKMTTTLTEQQTQSVYGQASLAWKEVIFLEGTIRNDWDSRLPSPHRITYPSVGASAILSDMMTMPNAFSFLKLNASYAVVGNGGQPQLLNNVYLFAPGAGNGLLYRRTTQAIPGLRPEKVASLEFGFDARLLDNRIGVTFNWYKTNSKNQLLKIGQPVGTGYVDKYINAGNIQNNGIEVTVNATPVKSGSFSWDVLFNLGINRNKVVELDPSNPGLRAYLGGSNGFSRTAMPVVESGGSYGDLFSKKWMRNENGQFVVNEKGVPVGTGDATYLGNFNPKATLGLTNSFTYKSFSARILIDGRIGGTIVDATEMNLAFSGVSEVTENYREGGWVLGGVDAEGNAVNVPINAQAFWAAGENNVSGQRYGIGEFFAYDATNFRIRELSIGYNIPVPSNFFIKSAKFSVVARNLAWLYRGESLLDIPGLGKRKLQIDPDMSLGNGNYQGIQLATLPSTRSIGCNLSLTF